MILRGRVFLCLLPPPDSAVSPPLTRGRGYDPTGSGTVVPPPCIFIRQLSPLCRQGRGCDSTVSGTVVTPPVTVMLLFSPSLTTI